MLIAILEISRALWWLHTFDSLAFSSVVLSLLWIWVSELLEVIRQEACYSLPSSAFVSVSANVSIDRDLFDVPMIVDFDSLFVHAKVGAICLQPTTTVANTH
jgi:hypothetical protein